MHAHLFHKWFDFIKGRHTTQHQSMSFAIYVMAMYTACMLICFINGSNLLDVAGSIIPTAKGNLSKNYKSWDAIDQSTATAKWKLSEKDNLETEVGSVIARSLWAPLHSQVLTHLRSQFLQKLLSHDLQNDPSY
jgi:hypothetical protein